MSNIESNVESIYDFSHKIKYSPTRMKKLLQFKRAILLAKKQHGRMTEEEWKKNNAQGFEFGKKFR